LRRIIRLGQYPFPIVGEGIDSSLQGFAHVVFGGLERRWIGCMMCIEQVHHPLQRFRATHGIEHGLIPVIQELSARLREQDRQPITDQRLGLSP
jgi:hypothetical protein